MKKIAYIPFLISVVIIACNGNEPGKDGDGSTPPPPVIPYTVVNTYPHDTTFFTEGLEFHQGQLFESSGSGSSEAGEPGAYPSAFGITDLKTGKVSIKAELDKKTYFGEGITFFKDKVYELTYKNLVGYVYDAGTFKKIKEFPLHTATNEAWALTHDSVNLIMSDGSNNLYFLHPDSLR